ncbi:hypothetical protein [Streptomyces sp. NPDC002057]|uniref:hypothetical protein n=1 Tax=Streptomyces sp. NPDC002057 TaxID=3154664 RepID=UPI00331DC92C
MNEKQPPVLVAEEALRGLGAVDAELEQRGAVSEGWFADWSDPFMGSDVYVGVMWASPTSPTARLLLDDWNIEELAVNDIGGVISCIFTGKATMESRKSLFGRSRLLTLKIVLENSRYTAYRRVKIDDQISPWEQNLITE